MAVQYRKGFILCVVLLLLIAGTSAVTFVINDGTSSLSLAATQDHEVAFSIVIAENPDSYSAAMSADDSSGASASQESNIGGADSLFTASVALSPNGDTAYTATTAVNGSSEITQEAHAGLGSSASVAQEISSIAMEGASVSNATDSLGNSAMQCIAFIFGMDHVNLTADTDTSATASQSGTFAGLAAHTIGRSRSVDGDESNTTAFLTLGGMSFDNTATAQDTDTIASQDVIMAGLLGSANASAVDQGGNFATQDARFIGGFLTADQTADTQTSANAVQTGGFAGLGAMTNGFAVSQEKDISHTFAGVFMGGMTFDNRATAQDTDTIASQDVMIGGLIGSAHAGSLDESGNIATQDAGFVGGLLFTNQTTDTVGSAHAVQEGDFAGLSATTNGFAMSQDGDISLTHAGVFIGGMTFDNTATAQDTTTTVSQDVMIAGMLGQAGADSFDHGNIATQDTVFAFGVLNNSLTANTLNSATATQNGDFAGLGATTAGFAISADTDVSTTWANVVVGGMDFTNTATAHDTNTTASQDVIMGGLLGSARAGAVDQSGNMASQAASFFGGVLTTDQTADTLDSANALQNGSLAGLAGSTSGFAQASNGDYSTANAGLIIGGMTFNDEATAQDTFTSSGQIVQMGGLAGTASVGSNDGMNSTEEGSRFILGSLNVTQEGTTIASAYATQSGNMSALLGSTWGEATSGGETSWTNADVLLGTMAFTNGAAAGTPFNTQADQVVNISGGFAGLPVAVAGNVSAGSDDGTGNVSGQGAGILGGTLDVHQGTGTGTIGSAATLQQGRMSAVFGTTWGEATSVDEKSWTNADVLLGTMAFTNGAAAGTPYNTQANQVVNIGGGFAGLPVAVAGNVSTGSDDGTENVTGQGAGILGGTLDVFQLSNTGGSGHSTQSGNMSALLGNTWGEARSGIETSWTDTGLLVGTMSFMNDAIADGNTEAGQTVNISGIEGILPFAIAGNVSAGSDDGMGNITQEGSGIILGIMDLTQQVNTTGSAHAVQSGTMSALYGNTWGEATYTNLENEKSWTKADMVLGTMGFDNNATADGSTKASQHVQIGGLDGIPVAGGGSTEVGATDGITTAKENSSFLVGTLTTTQSAHSDPVDAYQTGTMSALVGGISGEATSGTSSVWTKAGVGLGTMTYDSYVSPDPSPFANQHVQISGLDGIPVAGAGSTEVGSTDGTNTTRVGSEFILGVLDTYQHADASASAHAIQSGNMSAVLGSTWGEATYTNLNNERSWTKADLFLGTMNFDNNATADGSTEAGQHVQVPFAVVANASAGSNDGTGNITQEGSGITVGTMDVTQQVNTSGSAFATQSGSLSALLGNTWSNATSGTTDQSWTTTNVLIGVMNFTNSVYAGTGTEAGQNVQVPFAIAGNTSAGSTDGTNSAEVGAGYIVGILVDVTQQADTSASAHATQSGVIPAAIGSTWAEAHSVNESSWTNANVAIGLINMGENTAIAGASTKAFQSLNVTGLSGIATAASTDGTNSTEVGAEILGGNLTALGDVNWSELLEGVSIENPEDLLPIIVEVVGDVGGGGYIEMDQQADTSGSAHANQTGILFAFGNGTTWGEATSGPNQSWTSANVTTGLITMTNNTVVASGSTSARQQLNIAALGGNASVGSTDGPNGAEVGAALTLGNLNINQGTYTGGSAFADQSGTVTTLGGTGRTWGNATYGNNQSWTSTSVTSSSILAPGIITVTNNSVIAGSGTTNAKQNVNIRGLLLSPAAGSASAGSTDGTNNVTVGARFANGTLTMDQRTSTGGSAFANQSGSVTAYSAPGGTWSEATSGANRSWTTADVNSTLLGGIITVTSNRVYAGDAGTNASQNVKIAGPVILGITLNAGNGSAWIGSGNGTNYAKVGSGFNNGILTMNQQTNTTASAYANQSGTIDSYSTTLGGAWTHSEAGDTSNNRSAYVDTQAASGSTITGAKGVRITETSNAYSSPTNVTVYEQKSTARIIWALSGGQPSSTTIAHAQNSTATMHTLSSSVNTPVTNQKALAYANLTAIKAEIT